MQYERIVNQNAAGGAIIRFVEPVILPDGRGVTTVQVGHLRGLTVEDWVAAKIAEAQAEVDASRAYLERLLAENTRDHAYWSLNGCLYRLYDDGSVEVALGAGGDEAEVARQHEEYSRELTRARRDAYIPEPDGYRQRR